MSIILDTTINGARQRLTRRASNMDRPVLLRIHGGPGSSFVPPFFRLMSPLDMEDLFVVCYWDQGGSGPAYTAETPDSSITLDQILEDGLTVTQMPKDRFGKEKVYLECLSWGTTVGMFMAQNKPEWYHAYIGIGQMADQALSEKRSYEYVMNEAQKRKDSAAIEQLRRIGSPPYASDSMKLKAVEIERSHVIRYAPASAPTNEFQAIKTFMLYDGWTLKEKLGSFLGFQKRGPAWELLWPVCAEINLMRDIPALDIPVYMIQGEHDHNTETSVAQSYFDCLQAPLKMWNLFKGKGHTAHFENPQEYRSIVEQEVLK